MSFTDYFLDFVFSCTVGTSHLKPEEVLYVSTQDKTSVTTKKFNLPEKTAGIVRIVVVSDTHDRHHGIGKLPEGDILIHCGDILMVGRKYSNKTSLKKLLDFNNWLSGQPHPHKIVIAGNHDRIIEELGFCQTQKYLSNARYLENSFVEVLGITFFGSPLSSGSSKNKSFQSQAFVNETLSNLEKYEGSKIDVLITHGQGSHIAEVVKPKLHLWGHNHSSYGVFFPGEVARSDKVNWSFFIVNILPSSTYYFSNNRAPHSLRLVVCQYVQQLWTKDIIWRMFLLLLISLQWTRTNLCLITQQIQQRDMFRLLN